MTTQNQQNLVLITRPSSDADGFAREVEAAGFTPFIEPMLGIIPLDYKKSGLKDYPAFVFTSGNAVRVFGCPDGLREMMVFAVGAHTAAEARRQGYHRVISAEGDGMDLAALISKKLGPHSKILHIRGEHTAMPLEDILAKDKIKLDALIVYTAKTEDEFTSACREALESHAIKAVTFFSRRTAENFVKLIEKERLSGKLSSMKVLCISPAVLECVRNVPWGGAYSADRPDRASMINLLKGVCPREQ